MNFKTLILNGVRKRYSVGSTVGTVVGCFLRFLQFVFGIAVIGLYAQDLLQQHKDGKPYDPKWTYATALGTLSSFFAIIYFIIPLVISGPLALLPRFNLPNLMLDSIISILWLTLFGIFGKLYISKEATEGDVDLIRMKHAVWVDMANLALWTATAVWAGVRFWKCGKGSRAEKKDSEMGQI
ncbi:uncharacterized protein PADG_07361 [Paracoccidioides brasiliensis Pb18]|uniref:MARVEL domain-containing protein n=2 Tax=Paracoccidioides brasiliensis TaxID=121759 RepID=C1GJC5_PARBD|nr:uncharacterized protein PADG_07361 [Paracoccidioides brasiliensis Pb18]EEH42541.1 hypothetical protein PADG_07361 [Paracoccidioides brasiliensis Pb18]ODH26417.1 hypothetical protein ACO22_04635 [Paracoccidioides brasiliensis]ODH52005.1 hypothetical protein GX48_01793 [Paracoccidioides brasiliensis]